MDTKNTSIGGTYVYDPKTGQVVKVSDRIPKIISRDRGELSSEETGPCGRGECAGGACAFPEAE
jgi:hypothetical protein